MNHRSMVHHLSQNQSPSPDVQAQSLAAPFKHHMWYRPTAATQVKQTQKLMKSIHFNVNEFYVVSNSCIQALYIHELCWVWWATLGIKNIWASTFLFIFSGVPVYPIQPQISNIMFQLFSSLEKPGSNFQFQHHASPFTLRPAARLSASPLVLHQWCISGAKKKVWPEHFCSFLYRSILHFQQLYPTAFLKKRRGDIYSFVLP